MLRFAFRETRGAGWRWHAKRSYDVYGRAGIYELNIYYDVPAKTARVADRRRYYYKNNLVRDFLGIRIGCQGGHVTYGLFSHFIKRVSKYSSMKYRIIKKKKSSLLILLKDNIIIIAVQIRRVIRKSLFSGL